MFLLKDERDKCGQAKNQTFYLFVVEDCRPPERGVHPLPKNNSTPHLYSVFYTSDIFHIHEAVRAKPDSTWEVDDWNPPWFFLSQKAITGRAVGSEPWGGGGV